MTGAAIKHYRSIGSVSEYLLVSSDQSRWTCTRDKPMPLPADCGRRPPGDARTRTAGCRGRVRVVRKGRIPAAALPRGSVASSSSVHLPNSILWEFQCNQFCRSWASAWHFPARACLPRFPRLRLCRPHVLTLHRRYARPPVQPADIHCQPGGALGARGHGSGQSRAAADGASPQRATSTPRAMGSQADIRPQRRGRLHRMLDVHRRHYSPGQAGRVPASDGVRGPRQGQEGSGRAGAGGHGDQKFYGMAVSQQKPSNAQASLREAEGSSGPNEKAGACGGEAAKVDVIKAQLQVQQR